MINKRLLEIYCDIGGDENVVDNPVSQTRSRIQGDLRYLVGSPLAAEELPVTNIYTVPFRVVYSELLEMAGTDAK